MKIELKEIDNYVNFKNKVNKCPLSKLKIYDNGNLITLSEDEIEHLRFAGLSNMTVLEERLWEITKVFKQRRKK